MPLRHAPMAQSVTPLASKVPFNERRFAPVIHHVIASWPDRLAAVDGATPGIAMIGSVDGSWLLAPCGAGVDAAAIEDRVEHYMVRDVILITSSPALTSKQAEAARRIAHKTLAGPCGMSILGSCPDGAAITPSDYESLRGMVGQALCRLQDSALVPITASQHTIARGEVIGRDEDAVTLLAAYSPRTAASPLMLVGSIAVRVIETSGGYLLLPGSCVSFGPSFRSADAERKSRVLEDIHAGLLLPGPTGAYKLRHPRRFASLEAVAHYCQGNTLARDAKWQRLDPQVPS